MLACVLVCVDVRERERREAKYDTLSVAYLRLFCKKQTLYSNRTRVLQHSTPTCLGLVRSKLFVHAIM